jgi:hypothetical protein
MTISAPSKVMRLRLGSPPRKYDKQFATYVPDMKIWLQYEVSRTVDLEAADRSNFKHFEDIDLGNKERLVLYSADGSRFSLTVTDAGVLGTTEL